MSLSDIKCSPIQVNFLSTILPYVIAKFVLTILFLVLTVEWYDSQGFIAMVFIEFRDLFSKKKSGGKWENISMSPTSKSIFSMIKKCSVFCYDSVFVSCYDSRISKKPLTTPPQPGSQICIFIIMLSSLLRWRLFLTGVESNYHWYRSVLH